MVLSLQISAFMGENLLIIEMATLYVDICVCVVLGFWVCSHGRKLVPLVRILLTNGSRTKLFKLLSRNSGDSPFTVWLSALASENKRNFRNDNLSTESGREESRLLTAFGLHAGNRRPQICYQRLLATASKRCNPQCSAQKKNRVCIAKRTSCLNREIHIERLVRKSFDASFELSNESIDF